MQEDNSEFDLINPVQVNGSSKNSRYIFASSESPSFR